MRAVWLCVATVALWGLARADLDETCTRQGSSCVCDSDVLGDCMCQSGTNCVCRNKGDCLCNSAGSCSCENEGKCFCASASSCNINNRDFAFCKTDSLIGSAECNADVFGFQYPLFCVPRPTKNATDGRPAKDFETCQQSVLPMYIGPIMAGLCGLHMLCFIGCNLRSNWRNTMKNPPGPERKDVELKPHILVRGKIGGFQGFAGIMFILMMIGLFCSSLADEGYKSWPWAFIPLFLTLMCCAHYGTAITIFDPVRGTAIERIHYMFCCCLKPTRYEFSLEDMTGACVTENRGEDDEGYERVTHNLTVTRRGEQSPWYIATTMHLDEQTEEAKVLDKWLKDYHASDQKSKPAEEVKGSKGSVPPKEPAPSNAGSVKKSEASGRFLAVPTGKKGDEPFAKRNESLPSASASRSSVTSHSAETNDSEESS